MMIEKLLTIDEVAEITGLAVRTIYVRGGGTKTLPRVKIGHTLRWREADVRDWINRHVERPFDPRKAFRRSA
jgi:predicted DNA-binding transcriptional regulator AlpA